MFGQGKSTLRPRAPQEEWDQTAQSAPGCSGEVVQSYSPLLASLGEVTLTAEMVQFVALASLNSFREPAS